MTNTRKARLPETMTDDAVSSPEFFRSDLEELYENADKIERLADNIESNLNDFFFDPERRAMMGRGMTTLASNEMETLATLRSAKASSINQVLSAKIQISKMAQSRNKADSNADLTALAKEFNRLFLENAKQYIPKDATPETLDSDGVDIDKRIAELEANGDIQFTDNERATKYEHRGVKVKIAGGEKNPHFVACASDNGEVLTDWPESLLPDASELSEGIFHDTYFESHNGIRYDLI